MHGTVRALVQPAGARWLGGLGSPSLSKSRRWHRPCSQMLLATIVSSIITLRWDSPRKYPTYSGPAWLEPQIAPKRLVTPIDTYKCRTKTFAGSACLDHIHVEIWFRKNKRWANFGLSMTRGPHMQLTFYNVKLKHNQHVSMLCRSCKGCFGLENV